MKLWILITLPLATEMGHRRVINDVETIDIEGRIILLMPKSAEDNLMTLVRHYLRKLHCGSTLQ